jgi:U3 small nucleolar RNA-associated protein 15
MSDGTLSVRRRQPKKSEENSGLAGSGNLFLFGEQLAGIGQGRLKDKSRPKSRGDPNELVVEQRRRKRLKDYDRLLKAFKYSAALDAVLKKVGGLSIITITLLTCTLGCYSNDNVLSDSRAHTS